MGGEAPGKPFKPGAARDGPESPGRRREDCRAGERSRRRGRLPWTNRPYSPHCGVARRLLTDGGQDRMARRLITGIAAVVAVAAFWTGHPDAQTAGPVINGLSGSLADGATVQVSGSGFGTKTTAAPLKWDNFEAGANGSGLANWDYFGTRPTYSSTVRRNKSNLSARANFVNGAWNSAFGVDGRHLPQIYIDAWYWFDSGPPYSRNHKPLRLMSGGGAEPHL